MSHICLIEIKLAHASPGTMCASVMACGSHGIFRLHSCVDSIMPTWGNVIFNGFLVSLPLTTGATGTTKVHVASASNIMTSFGILILGAGLVQVFIIC